MNFRETLAEIVHVEKQRHLYLRALRARMMLLIRAGDSDAPRMRAFALAATRAHAEQSASECRRLAAIEQ